MTRGIVTNGAASVQNATLDALEVRDAVNAVLISETEGVRKPDAAIFHRAAERLGVRPDECCFVGDHPTVDIAGAEAAFARSGNERRTGCQRRLFQPSTPFRNCSR